MRTPIAFAIAFSAALSVSTAAPAQGPPEALAGDGDGGAATAASLAQPVGVAVDAAGGGVLIADTQHHRIRRVRPDGVIVTVAGTGRQGFAGDDNGALQATLDRPFGVAALPNGAIVIADTGNDRVRMVAPDGGITTIAGTGTPGFSGDGGPATEARLDDPVGVGVTPQGVVLIADRGNNRIRRINAGVITTVAGDGSTSAAGDGARAVDAGLDQPAGVAATDDGGFLIADAGHHAIRRVSFGIISTVAGTGAPGAEPGRVAAVSADLAAPAGVAATPDTGFAFADTATNLVQSVSFAGTLKRVAGQQTIAASAGQSAETKLSSPTGIAALVDGTLLVADTGAGRVRAIARSGVVTLFAGSGAPPRPRPSPLTPTSARFYLVNSSKTLRHSCQFKLKYHTTRNDVMGVRAGGSSLGTKNIFTFDHYVKVRVRLSRGDHTLKATVTNLGSDTLELHVKRNCT